MTTTATSIVKYDAMRYAIDTCHRVDVVKGIRDKAEALRHVCKVAKDEEGERKCAEIRIRAERKAGQLLRVMRERGERRGQGQPSNVVSRDVTPSLRDMGISRDQSSQWQQLAEVPDRQFEAGLRRQGRVPTTNQFVQPSGGHFSGKGTHTCEWYTPAKAIEAVTTVLGAIDLDPASCEAAQRVVKAKRFFTKADDGLTKEWRGRVWLNPPYSDGLLGKGLLGKFVAKLATELQSGRCTEAITVLPTYATDSPWFHEALSLANAICFARPRIKFFDQDGNQGTAPPSAHVFFYYGDHVSKFVKTFAAFGLVALIKKPVRKRDRR